MPGPIAVIADDLTGAAEVAAVAQRTGLSAVILRRIETPLPAADVIVLDTDSRLDMPHVAAVKIAAAAGHFAEARVFKKVDSVLRGSVARELEALMKGLGKTRALLVPANPSLGRTIRDGQYFVHDVPLHETAFSKDPHHPARSSAPGDLLGWPVSILHPSDPFPDSGIIVGEAATSADIVAWADRVDDDTIAAGGSDFFSAWLRREPGDPSSRIAPSLGRGILMVLGSTAPEGKAFRERADAAGIACYPVPHEHLDAWQEAVANTLATERRVIVFADESWLHDPSAPEWLRKAFGELAGTLSDRVDHLIVEGGATAGTILDALGWVKLAFVYEWAPGVVSLQPRPETMLTLKPGSYEWPAELCSRLLSR